jgi:hypothetical protein
VRLLEFLTEHFERALTVIFIAGFLLFVASAYTGTGGALIGGDAAFYFEYVRSLLADGHLPHEHIKYPCGVALVGVLGYGPVMLVARMMSAAGVALDPRWESGWSLPAQVAYCLPLLALSWIAFRTNASMFVRLGFSERVVKPMILFWITSTNIGFYVLKEPAMSEGVTYAALSLYYWALIRWFYETPAERALRLEPMSTSTLIRRAAVIGLFLGFAGMVRQQNILHCFAVPLLLMSPVAGRLNLRRRAAAVGIAAVASVPLFTLPWIVWYAGTGRFVLYSYGDEGFNFLSPHLLLVLFHPGYHGLFAFHPAYAVATAGLVGFLWKHRELAPTWFIAIAIQVYLTATWHFLSFGASVGHRGFFSIAPLLLAGWIVAGEWALARRRPTLLTATVALLTLGNAVITLLVMTNRINPLGIQPG